MGDLLAILTPQRDLLPCFDNPERRFDRLMIGYATRIGTTYETLYRFGDRNRMLFDHLEVTDDIH